jgi:hypothetical protein
MLLRVNGTQNAAWLQLLSLQLQLGAAVAKTIVVQTYLSALLELCERQYDIILVVGRQRAPARL